MIARKPLNLDAIRARCDAASPGPWLPLLVSDHPSTLTGADRVFVAHARTDIPALIAEIERLQALLELTHKGLESLDRHTAKVQEALTSLQRGDDELRAYLAWLLDPRLTAADFEIVLMWRIADYPPPSRLLGGGPVRARPLPDDGSHR